MELSVPVFSVAGKSSFISLASVFALKDTTKVDV